MSSQMIRQEINQHVRQTQVLMNHSFPLTLYEASVELVFMCSSHLLLFKEAESRSSEVKKKGLKVSG